MNMEFYTYRSETEAPFDGIIIKTKNDDHIFFGNGLVFGDHYQKLGGITLNIHNDKLKPINQKSILIKNVDFYYSKKYGFVFINKIKLRTDTTHNSTYICFSYLHKDGSSSFYNQYSKLSKSLNEKTKFILNNYKFYGGKNLEIKK